MSRRLVAPCLIVALSAVGAAQFSAPPEISAVSDSTPNRSQRLVVYGAGFGDGVGGQVLIDQLPAIVTRWFPDEIHAYVPEGASVGLVNLEVATGEGSSEPFPLTVSLRQPNGRINWRFQTDRWMNRQFVRVAPDGMIYVSDQVGLYALSPDGALLWFAPNAGNGRAIDVGSDGTIYTSSSPEGGPVIVKALNPDGSLRWQFIPPVPWVVVAGPNVGPDGNVYAVQGNARDGGLGAFSLTAEGELRWASPGEPVLDEFTVFDVAGNEVVFAPNQLYLGVFRLRSGQPVTYSFNLAGEQLWQTGTSGLNVSFFSFPRVDPFGRIIGLWGQTGIIALAEAGDVAFAVRHPSQSNVIMPTVDSRGFSYASAQRSRLFSLDTQGSFRWSLPTGQGSLFHIGVSPNDEAIVVGWRDSPGPAHVRGYDTETGALRWQVELPDEEGLAHVRSDLYPRFSPDSRTAYLMTHLSNVVVADFGYLFAIDISQ